MELEAGREQARLVATFSEGIVAGAAWPVTRIDTHLSHVFLAGERVYKVKRAVQLPSVDFSTFKRRAAACTAELVVNRRFDPPRFCGRPC